MSGHFPPVAILAGGLATRLKPITEKIPKSLVEIAGEPFIAHQLRQLRGEGARKIMLCIGHLGEQIENFVTDGSSFGLAVEYSQDGDRQLGTGGSLKKALPKLGDEFLVLYGDSYLPTPFAPVAEAFHASKKPALMTVYQNKDLWDQSNVVFEDGRILAYDKKNKVPEMKHIDYGLGAFRAVAFDGYEKGAAFDLAGLYGDLLAQGQLAGYEVHERFYEIGSQAGMRETDAFFKKGKTEMTVTAYTKKFLEEAVEIIGKIDQTQIDKMVAILVKARADGGRLFILGVGGSAGNAGHAVNDFRKIAGIESYAPTDNVSELTARTNDDGWDSVFVRWLETSRLSAKDVVLVFSVGGGNLEKNVSPNLVRALQLAKKVQAKIIGIVGRDGGYTKQVADAYALIPTVNPETITPHSEAFQAVVWHLIVTHPDLKKNEMKWESIK